MEYYALVVLLFASCAIHVNGICMDISTSACEMMERNDPSICTNTELARSACRKYCNICSSNLTCYSCTDPIQGTSMCNLTRECKQGEVCQLREIKSTVDHHFEYASSCAVPQECDGNSVLTLVGRDTEEHHAIHSRNLLVSCCKTDLCNTPSAQTMTNTPSTAITTPQPSTAVSSGCSRDILVIIHVAERDYSYTHMTTEIFMLLHSIVHDIDVGPMDSLMELALVDDHLIHKFRFSDYHDKTSLLQGLHRAFDVHHHTNTINATSLISYIQNDAFAPYYGQRRNYKNDMIFFVDYQAYLTPSSLNQAGWNKAAWDRLSGDVTVVNIGGSVWTPRALNSLATDSNHILHVSGYDTVYTAKKDLLRLMCE